jgi:hypothetical protein
MVASKLMQHYRVFTPLSAGTGIQSIADSAGNIELITLGNDGNLYNLWPDAGSDTGWQITSLNTSQLGLGKVASFTATSSPSSGITVLATFADAPNATYTLSDQRWSPGWQRVNQLNNEAKAPQVGGSFSVQNGALFYRPPGGQSVKLSGDATVSTTYASGRNFEGFLEVFILGTDGSLYHVRAAPDLTQPSNIPPDPDAATNWTHMVRLNPVQSNSTLTYSLLTLANDKDGYSRLFAVTATDDLYEIWQDAETTDWKFEEIEIPDYNPQNEGGATPINVYMTEITVLDGVGAPRPQTAVTLWTSDQTPVTVNGRSTNLDALTPYQCLSNSAGKVTILVETETIDAPMLKVTTDFMVGDEYISIEPNAYVQDKLLTVNADALQNTKNLFSGEPVTVIPPDIPVQALDAVASGVSQCMSLAGQRIAPSNPVDIPGPEQQGAPKYLGKNKKLNGVKYVSGSTGKFERRIDLANVQEQHWRFIFDHKTKNHRFEKLTREQAAHLMAERRTQMKPASSVSDWFDVDWGDVWEEIENVAEFVVTTVVDTITNVVTAIEAQINLVIDGISYIFEQAVNFVEEVFDAVEGIFEAVGAFFEQLFDWFAFLFKWGDILLTQQALSALVTEVALPFAGQVFGAGGTLNYYLKNQIQSFQNNLNTTFSAFLSSPGIKNSGSMLALQQTIPPTDVNDQTAGTNLAFSALLDNADSVEFSNTSHAAVLQAMASGDNPFTALTNELVSSLGDFFNDPAFSNAAAYFEAIGSNPDQFLQNTLSGILSIIQGVLNAGLNVASAVIDAVFACFQSAINLLTSLLTDTLYVPLASELYTLVTGIENMTIIGLFSLIAAIPVTIGYKLLFGAAPFADQTAVEQFIQQMNEILGDVGAAARGETRLTAAPRDIPNGLAQFLGSILILGFPVYGIIESVLDMWIVPPDTPLAGEGIALLTGVDKYAAPPAALSWAAVAMEWLLFIAALPTSPAAPSCANAAEMATMTWLVGGLSPLLDTGWMVYTSTSSSTGTIMRNSGTLGTATDWILGMVQFGMLCGLVAKQVDENQADAASTTQGFFAAVPGLFKFFRLPPINRWEPGLAILGVLDIVGDFGAGIAEVWVVNELNLLPAPRALETAGAV